MGGGPEQGALSSLYPACMKCPEVCPVVSFCFVCVGIAAVRWSPFHGRWCSESLECQVTGGWGIWSDGACVPVQWEWAKISRLCGVLACADSASPLCSVTVVKSAWILEVKKSIEC